MPKKKAGRKATKRKKTARGIGKKYKEEEAAEKLN